MRPPRLVSHSPEETRRIGAALARHVPRGRVLALVGDLGAGKTCFAKGFAEGLGIAPDEVTSPTFAIHARHRGGSPAEAVLEHLDVYRLADAADLLDTGFLDLLDGQRWVLLEWADRAPEAVPGDGLWIDFAHEGGDRRSLEFRGPWRAEWLADLPLSAESEN